MISHAPHSCHKTFTVPMVRRAVRATYAGAHDVSEAQRRRLGRYVRCARNPKARPRLHAYWHHAIEAWRLRVAPPTIPALASWYDDSGTTGCGFHATYGIATFVVPCGGHVTITGPAGTVTATRDDSGPYVAGRTFDLGPVAKAALGCSDLCSVRFRVEH